MTDSPAGPFAKRPRGRPKGPPKVKVPKPGRGLRGPGVRGPAKSAAELEAEHEAMLERNKNALARANLKITHAGGTIYGAARSREAHQLQDLIQKIGDEVIDPHTGWNRIEAVIRRVYADALGGKISAQELIFNRGWGRVPMPLKINVSAELTQALVDSGLSQEEALADPLLRHLLESGTIVEGKVSGGEPERSDS